MRLNLKVSVGDNNLVNLARKVLRLIEFTCITTGCIPPPAFLTSTAVAITTMVAWKKSKYENSPLFLTLVIKDQISHLVHSFAQASLTASSCVNFVLNEQAGAGCRQQEHADWKPQRWSHTFDCFRFLFIFLRPVDLIRKLSKEAFHLMNE